MWLDDWPREETDGPLDDLRVALDDCARDPGGTPAAGWLLSAPTTLDAAAWLDRLEAEALARGCAVVAGGWRRGVIRPFGGLLDIVESLARTLGEDQPDLVHRYGRMLLTLLPGLRDLEPLADVQELRAGLPAYAMNGNRSRLSEFYQRRDLVAWIQADLVHFTLDGAQAIAVSRGAPVVLLLEGLRWADAVGLETLARLAGYAAGLPVAVCASACQEADEVTAALGDTWSTRTVPAVSGGAGPALDAWLCRSAAERQDLVRRAAVIQGTFDREQWSGVAAGEDTSSPPVDVGAAADALIADGILRPVGDTGLRFARTGVATALAEGLESALSASVHGRAAELLSDPFAVAYHAAAGGRSDLVYDAGLDAMARAWAVSSYGAARGLAEMALGHAPEDSDIEGELLRGLLCYEAAEYAEADRWLLASLERGHPPDRVATLEHMLGYNAIFGLGDFDRGKAILERVLAYYDDNGRERAANYVRNSMAFALFRTRRYDQAIALETTTLEGAEKKEKHDDNFLLTILQLNLGRLYRTVGDTDRALAFFEGSLSGGNLEHVPSILLLVYSAIGQLRDRRDEPELALPAYHHCLDLARNLDLDARQEHVLQSLVHRIPPPAGLLRGDQLLFCMHSSLAATYHRLGATAWRDAYLAGIERVHGARLGEEDRARLAAEVGEVAPQAGEHLDDSVDRSAGFRTAATRAVSHFGDVLQPRRPENLGVRVAEALAEGRVVALTRPRTPRADLEIVDSVVLVDPRRRDLAERINPEVVDLNVNNLMAARSAVVLPSDLDRFVDAPHAVPLVYQEATLRPEQRAALPAVVPIRLRLQVLDSGFDGLLHDILEAFKARTGLGLMAALPFALQGRDAAANPEQACCAFLISSIDLLVLEDRAWSKAYGSTAAVNLRAFRPRLSQWAFTVERENDVVIRIKSRGGYANGKVFRVRSAMRELLEACDGETSVREIVGRLEGRLGVGEQLERQVGDFLRQLWRRGIIRFGDPDLDGPVATDEGVSTAPIHRSRAS